MSCAPGARQSGVAVVEFAIIASLFFLVMLGIVELGRLMFTWNSAAEATRAGARVAAISPVGSTRVHAAMRAVLPRLNDSQIAVEYRPAGCDANTCQELSVSVVDYRLAPLFIPVPVLPVPSARTTVPRESLGLN